MTTTVKSIPPRFIYLAIFILCAGLLGFGLYLQYVGGLEPCPLCIFQRVFFLAAGGIALLAGIHNPRRLGSLLYSTLIAIAAVVGGGIAARQIWLQHLPPDQVPECGPGLEFMLEAYPLADTIMKALKGTGDCAEVAWRFLGFSIAEWSIAFFIVITLVSLGQIKTAITAKA